MISTRNVPPDPHYLKQQRLLQRRFERDWEALAQNGHEPPAALARTVRTMARQILALRRKAASKRQTPGTRRYLRAEALELYIRMKAIIAAEMEVDPLIDDVILTSDVDATSSPLWGTQSGVDAGDNGQVPEGPDDAEIAAEELALRLDRQGQKGIAEVRPSRAILRNGLPATIKAALARKKTLSAHLTQEVTMSEEIEVTPVPANGTEPPRDKSRKPYSRKPRTEAPAAPVPGYQPDLPGVPLGSVPLDAEKMSRLWGIVTGGSFRVEMVAGAPVFHVSLSSFAKALPEVLARL